MRSRLRHLPRRLHILAISLIALVATWTSAQAVLGPVLVFDAETGEVLIEERAGEPWYPASLTKLMTAFLVFEALEAGELTLDQAIPVSEAAAKLPASKIGIPAGQTLKVELALKGLLIHSANDMAVVLAEAVSGSVADFVSQMNQTAKILGMDGSHFANPHGLPDPRQVSTARDLGLLAAAILDRFPQAQDYFAAPDFVIGGVTLRNRNGLLRQMPQADGMKTGFICDSGFNLIASASFEERRLVSVVLGAKSAPSRNVLSQVLLEQANDLDRSGGDRRTLAELDNLLPDAAAPLSLSAMMCEGASRVHLISPQEPTKWGVSFGRYPAPLTAEAVMTGRLLAVNGGAATDLTRGILHEVSSDDYLGLVWDMTMSDARTLCAEVRIHEAPCDVLSPRSFADLARKSMSRTAGAVESAKSQSEGSQ
jgi:D-alanyl-D-alanine carboxypeptidase